MDAKESATPAHLPLPVMAIPHSELQYERQDEYLRPLAAQSSTMPKIALLMAAIHAAFTAGLACLLGLGPFNHEHSIEAVLCLLALQIPTCIATVILSIKGHRFPGGRRLAGPAMWIAGLTPAGSALLIMAVGAMGDDAGNDGYVAGWVTVAIDLLIVFGLRNRILKEHRGPLPVIPIAEQYGGPSMH